MRNSPLFWFWVFMTLTMGARSFSHHHHSRLPLVHEYPSWTPYVEKDGTIVRGSTP